MRPADITDEAESIELQRQGCATYSASTYTCTNGDCKETTVEFRKCPGLPLQRLQRSSDGSSSWVKHSGDQPFSGGSGDFHSFMRSVMCVGCHWEACIRLI